MYLITLEDYINDHASISMRHALGDSIDEVEGTLECRGESTKWYDAEHDMKHLSRDFPALFFTLTGEGEEAGDLWKMYCKNGRCQRVNAEITYPDPDTDFLNGDRSQPAVKAKRRLEGNSRW